MQTKNKSNEDNIRKRETKNETRKDVSEDDYNRKVERNEELQKQVRDYEEADKLIKETTGADDISIALLPSFNSSGVPLNSIPFAK